MSLTVGVLIQAVADAHAAMRELEHELNAADARLGDGDTGGMLARVIGRMAEQNLAGDDVGAAFSALARAAAGATGSSLGTLMATALLTIGRETRGEREIPDQRMAELLAKALDAMMTRRGASLGDKTVLDSLDAIIAALEAEATKEAALAAAETALERFRDRPNRIGRARMFGDATIGSDDPGMLAVAKLGRAVLGGPTA